FIIGFSMVLISCKKEVPVVENSAKSETNTIVADSLQPTKITTEAGTPALNPPHGQPNHRCDIAVGAPLNSPSNQTQTHPTQIQPVQTQQAPVVVTNPTGVKPKTNPAHGQPFHRCDLQVGAPLPDA
ncbi:MAG: hypothetical protein Q7U08_07425, partial [Flavobacteriaceae bacterium]|nr:hypothetical protein [Flavobacteriaceae bacterium]